MKSYKLTDNWGWFIDIENQNNAIEFNKNKTIYKDLNKLQIIMELDIDNDNDNNKIIINNNNIIIIIFLIYIIIYLL